LTSEAAPRAPRATRRIVSSPAIVPTTSVSRARSSASASACAWPRPVRTTTSCWTRSTLRRNSAAARSRAAERRLGAEEIGAGPLIGAVAGPLHQTEILDVARNRRLRRLEAALQQAAPQHLLAVERFLIDQLEEDGLAARFHVRTAERVYIDFC
jgi:hypothetical protein